MRNFERGTEKMKNKKNERGGKCTVGRTCGFHFLHPSAERRILTQELARDKQIPQNSADHIIDQRRLMD